MSAAPEPLLTLRDGPETVLRRVQRNPGDWVVTKQVRPGADPLTTERITARLKMEYDFASAVCRRDGFLAPQGMSAGGVAFGDAQCTLAQLVRELGGRNKKLDPPLVARVLYRCLQALDHLHQHKYGHGALTADGVFVTPGGDVALGDFVGYRYDRNMAPVKPEYPLWYRAPELIDLTLDQAIPEKLRAAGTPAAVRADLYSAGYLAIQLLRPGDEFFRLFNLDAALAAGDHNWDVWHGDISLEAPRLDNVLYDVPVGLRQVLQPLIEKAPAARLKLSVHAVLDQIDRLGLMSNKMLPRYGPPPEPEKPPPDTRHDRVFLRLTAHDGLSRVFPAARRVLVGSSSVCDVPLRHQTVSSKHALAVHRGSAGWWVYDLKSDGGTRVDREPVTGRGLPVRSNQRVKFGTVALTATVHRGFWFGVNRFLVADTLHESRNSTVYRAIWVTRGGSEVAVKVFPPEFQTDPDAIRRFLRSLPEPNRVRHPHIVSVYRGGFMKSEAKGRRWYLAMRYMPNGSLRDQLTRRGQLSVPQAVRCGRHIASAIQAVAQLGLVHRNINPKCILFDGDMSARLSDFVLCRQEDLETYCRVTRAGETLMADYAYQAPEQLQGGTNVPWLSDQYSLAACLFEALTGTPAVPSQGRTLPEIIAAVGSAAVPSARALNANVPNSLDDLLRRALAKDPKGRYPTPESFLEALRASGER